MLQVEEDIATSGMDGWMGGCGGLIVLITAVDKYNDILCRL